MKTLFATTAAALILSVGAAMAQTPVPDFETVDTDSSGGITWEELSAAFTGTVSEEDFAAADVDGNMELSIEEFATLEVVATLVETDNPNSTEGSDEAEGEGEDDAPAN